MFPTRKNSGGIFAEPVRGEEPWRADCERALKRMRQADRRLEALTAAKDAEITAVEAKYAERLAAEVKMIERLEEDLERCYIEHQTEIETGGRKSVQLKYGVIGMRLPTNPALIPIEKNTWATITAKVRAKYRDRFFLAPAKPGLDKQKLKRTLNEAQLKAVGLALDRSEMFFAEPARRGSSDSEAAA